MISPTPRIWRHDFPFPKVQEVWIIQQSAFFTPNRLRRAFILKYFGNENHRKAPGSHTFLKLIQWFDETGAEPWRERPRLMKIEEPPSPKKTSRSSKTTLWRLKSIHKASDHLDLCYSKVWTILHGLTRQRRPYLPSSQFQGQRHQPPLRDQVAPLLARFKFPWLLLVVRHDQRPTMQAGDHWGIGGGCQIRRAHLSCPHDPHGSRKCSEKHASRQKGATLKPDSNSFRSSTLSLYLLMFINSFLWSFQISI